MLQSSTLSSDSILSTGKIQLLSFAFVIILALGLDLPVMNIDAAQYAELSREMAKSNDWLHLTIRHSDYLDKPPLHFWFAAISFKIFGVHNWSYRLPSFLFFILGLVAVIRTAKHYYGPRTGAVAGLFYASAFSAFMMCSDVRTDTLLVGSVACAIWMFALFESSRSIKYMIAFSIMVGLAMLTKGPMGIIFPGLAIGFHLVMKRNWKLIFHPAWFIVPIMAGVMLFPMCVGLYEQFDYHPEKMVNGTTGVSGLKFYFWTQSFGRITGESEWGTKFNNGATNLFFTHTFLWTFAPWTLMALGGLVAWMFRNARKKLSSNGKEAISWGGFILIFIALSLSRYKLPHYLYVTIPFASVFAAVFFVQVVESSQIWQRVFKWVHAVAVIAVLVLVQFILFCFFPGAGWWFIVICEAGCLFTVYFLFLFRRMNVGVLLPLATAMLTGYFVLLCWFYPNLLRYDSGHAAGVALLQNGYALADVYADQDIYDYTFSFYSKEQTNAKAFDPAAFESGSYKAPFYLWIKDESYSVLESKGIKATAAWHFDHYSVQFLTMPFLIPANRAERLSKRWLLFFSADQEQLPARPAGH